MIRYEMFIRDTDGKNTDETERSLMAGVSGRCGIFALTEAHDDGGRSFVTLLLTDDTYVLSWGGLCRCYLAEYTGAPGTRIAFTRLTKDDVWQNDPSLTEGLSKPEIIKHPDFGKPVPGAHVLTGKIPPGSVFILADSGICKNVDIAAFTKAAASMLDGTADGFAEALEQTPYLSKALSGRAAAVTAG